jgi:hypothetical protein
LRRTTSGSVKSVGVGVGRSLLVVTGSESVRERVKREEREKEANVVLFPRLLSSTTSSFLSTVEREGGAEKRVIGDKRGRQKGGRGGKD